MTLTGPNPLFELSGKSAIVTGGTRGLGLMIARGLLDAGCRVLVTSRDPETGEQAQEELAQHGEVISVTSNLSTEAGCRRFAEVALERLGRLDVLVNNAGANWAESLESYPDSAWNKVIALNLKAPFFLVQQFLDALQAAGTADSPARVINIGSVDGLHAPAEPIYAYSASKAALHQLTRVLASELGPRNVTVNSIAPGAFESKMMAATLARTGSRLISVTPLGRIGRPDDIAGVAVFLASRAAAFVTGVVLPVDGGIVTTL